MVRNDRRSLLDQTGLICLVIVCNHSTKSLPAYLVFCYIPPQSKTANILRNSAEQQSQASLEKMAGRTERPGFRVHREKKWWFVCERDKEQLSGFISKEDGNVLLSSVCPMPQKHGRLSIKVHAPSANLHSDREPVLFHADLFAPKRQKKEEKSCRKWTWAVRSRDKIRSRRERSQVFFFPSESVSKPS